MPTGFTDGSADTLARWGRPLKARANVMLAFGLVIVIFVLLFKFYGYENTWKLWNVPAASPHFLDLRVITAGAESRARGYDPLVENPSHPNKTRMNYPRIWQKLFWLGFDQRHTTYIGVGFILLFVAGACLVLPHLSNARIALIMAAVLSPAALLCVERANNDLLMFFLVAVSVVAARRRPVLSTAVILLGFVLKLYPVFATAVLLRADRTLFLRCVSVIFVFALIYVFATFADLVLVREATPRSTDLAYGIDVFWMKAASLAPTWGIETFARVLCYLAALLSLSCAFVTLLRDDLPEVFRIDSVYLDSFRAGAAVYVGTFLLGNNWDYRLLFLVFTIPQLLVWANCPVRHVSWLARITLLAVYSSLWYLMVVLDFLPYGFVVSLAICEISKWTAFACLAYLLSLSAPHWIKQYGEKLRSLTYLRKG